MSPGLLNKTCTIVRKTFTKSAMGASVPSYSDAATSVPCAVQVNTAAQRMEPAQAAETEYNVFFAYFVPNAATTTQPRNSDRILAISNMVNLSLSLTSGPIDDSGRGAYIRFTAKNVTGEAGL